MSASIHDVAKRAGVSIATVSRVINQSAGVKEAKVKAVKEALEYFDYEPSQFGRGLVTGSSKMIGVYSPLSDGSMFRNGYLLECLRGIDNIIRESPYSMLLINETSNYYKNRKEKPKFLQYVNQKRIDGLLVLTIPSDGKLEGALSAIMEQNFPVGYIGKKFYDKGVNVYASYEEYMLDAMKQLYEQGHRKIAFLPVKYRSNTNIKIITKAETKFSGLEISLGSLDMYSDPEYLEKVMHTLMEEKGVTAIICEELYLVIKLQGFLNTLNKTIPENMSIISVEHFKGQGMQLLPIIDCYYVPAMEIGETIAKELLELLEGNKEDNNSKIFHPEYIKRGSVKYLET